MSHRQKMPQMVPIRGTMRVLTRPGFDRVVPLVLDLGALSGPGRVSNDIGYRRGFFMPRGVYVRQSLEDRFWAKVDKRGPDECWPWTGAPTPKGYGVIRDQGRYVRAHRLAWELANGPIPDDLLVCHRCDNPPCCNPADLFLGTNADNSADMVRKGRGAPLGGQNNNSAKLTDADVNTIRRLWGTGAWRQRDIADVYHVGQPAISRIVTQRRWVQA